MTVNWIANYDILISIIVNSVEFSNPVTQRNELQFGILKCNSQIIILKIP